MDHRADGTGEAPRVVGVAERLQAAGAAANRERRVAAAAVVLSE
jgi:hypothetical protein